MQILYRKLSDKDVSKSKIMFKVYQVRFSSHDKHYRGQLICGRSSHHHHLFTATPCSSKNIQQTSYSTFSGMPPFLVPSNYQSYVNTTKQLDSVALYKIVSQITPEINSSDQMIDNSISNRTTIENNTSRTLQETLTASRNITTNTTSETLSSNGYLNDTIEEDSMKSFNEKDDPELTWINWDWPGSHAPCPFNPCNMKGQSSTRTHHLLVRYKSYNK